MRLGSPVQSRIELQHPNHGSKCPQNLPDLMTRCLRPTRISWNYQLGYIHQGWTGFTLVELIVATAILVILTGMALPLARVTIRRQKERELRYDLWQLRDAIDYYKEAADRGAFQIKAGSDGYPPDLDTLVKGVDEGSRRVRFLRRIPVDPMTGRAEWGLHSEQDDPDSDSWGGQNVFDVYTKSSGTALDGTKYKDW